MGLHDQGTTPQCCEPIEDLCTGWNGHEHGHDHEQRSPERVHTRCQHVVAPDDEPNDANSRHGEHHGLVSKDGPSCRSGEHFRDDTKGRDNDNVHFRVAEEPEQVLEEQGVATRNKELSANGVVKEKESDTDDKGWKGHEKHEHADEHRPGEQWHLHPCDARSAHGEHGGDEVHTTQCRRCPEHEHA